MEQSKEPHLISIKVLRLSRPTLAAQDPLTQPLEAPLDSLDARASLAYPTASERPFTLSPLLSLPTGFGTAFVGSTFSCTISANNELPSSTSPSAPSISSVHIGAEISTPSSAATPSAAPLSLALTPEEEDGDASTDGLAPGGSVQKLLAFDLREEGAHVLAVNVSYEITTRTPDGTAVTGRRTRLFRKLYQFAAVPCLSVRTKATALGPPAGADGVGERFALEAQLENLTDAGITLEQVTFNAKSPFAAASLNWDLGVGTEVGGHLASPTLSPRAVHQVCHVVYEGEELVATDDAVAQKEFTKDGRVVLGALSIKWRGPMGDPGILSTGWLTSKRR